jgi:collagen type VII alpha
MALTRIQSSGIEGNITLGNVVISGTITDGTGAVFVAGTGAVGFTGSAGTAGTNGFTGSVGSAGFIGSAGTNGFTGSSGATGSTGTTGFVGSSGAVGFTGSASTEIGFTGSLGTQGNVGFAGSRGDTGFAGSQGTPGEAAAIGYTGSQGFVGSRGEQGLAGVSTSSLVVDTFTGTGSTTAFNLSVQPTGINQTLVTVNGSVQAKNTYSLSGAVLTFDQAPANAAAVEVTIFVYGLSNFVGRNYTGDGSTATFAVSSGITSNSVIVSDNGVVQSPLIDYTISGSTLTFAIAPAAGSIVHIREIPAGTVGDVGFTGSSGAGFTGSSGSAGYTGSVGQYSGTTDQPLVTTNNASSTNTTTGALIVAGGAGIAGNLNVGGTTFVTGDILPTSNNTVNIGSPTARFGTIYVSANTIDIGGATISTTAEGELNFNTSSGTLNFDANVFGFLSNVSTQGAGATFLTVGTRTAALNISTVSASTISVGTRSGNITLNFS